MEQRDKPHVGVAIITHNAEKHLKACLFPLLSSSLAPRIVVVNSSSQDNTVALAQEMGVETLVIPRKEFNHGSTRELARIFLATEIVVMMTPDAYATSPDMLARLIAPIIKKEAEAVYARQIAHDGADIFEAFPREFNYPPISRINSCFDTHALFFSNSCAAYLNAALDKAGGFDRVLLGEDTLAVAKLLKRGYKVAYAADAVVKHSHHYSLLQEFRRHFDTGLARRQLETFLSIKLRDERRGREYVKTLFKHLIKKKPCSLPYAVLHIMAKWTGYKLGRKSVRAPLAVKKLLSSQGFYWESILSDPRSFLSLLK